jgi:hypothetical protein
MLEGGPPGGGDGGGGQLPGLPDIPWDKLAELLLSFDPQGGYSITGPCERGPDGELLPPRAAAWGASTGLERNILKRVDALAELLQHHKDLKQPICPPGRAVGQPVTVTFEEVLEG